MTNSASWTPAIGGIIFLMVAAGGAAVHFFFRRLRRSEEDLRTVGWEIKCEFEAELRAVVPYIYNRPTRLFPGVEAVRRGWSLGPAPKRVLLTVRLGKEEDFERVKEMVRGFVDDFRKKKENRRYNFRIFLTSMIAEQGAEVDEPDARLSL